jgi:hypothetical protein
LVEGHQRPGLADALGHVLVDVPLGIQQLLFRHAGRGDGFDGGRLLEELLVGAGELQVQAIGDGHGFHYARS